LVAYYSGEIETLLSLKLHGHLICCIGRRKNDIFVSNRLIGSGCHVVCDGSGGASCLCFPSELGSIQAAALLGIGCLDRPGTSGSRIELFCGLSQFIGNWSLVIGYCLGTFIIYRLLPITKKNGEQEGKFESLRL
jgi:hypothetical protein